MGKSWMALGMALFCCVSTEGFAPSAAALVHSQIAAGTAFMPLHKLSLRNRVHIGYLLKQYSARREVRGGVQCSVADQGGKEGNAGIVRAVKHAGVGIFVLACTMLPLSKKAGAGSAKHYQPTYDYGIMRQEEKGMPTAQISLAAGAAIVSFGSSCAISIKKEKKRAALEQEDLEKDVQRLIDFNDEFLEGIKSDRSIYSELKKAQNMDDTEDEFDRNVRKFLEEEEEDKKRKDKKEGRRKESPTVLERPSDDDASLDDFYSKEDHSRAKIDDSVLSMLEKMMGSQDGDPPNKKSS